MYSANPRTFRVIVTRKNGTRENHDRLSFTVHASCWDEAANVALREAERNQKDDSSFFVSEITNPQELQAPPQQEGMDTLRQLRWDELVEEDETYTVEVDYTDETLLADTFLFPGEPTHVGRGTGKATVSILLVRFRAESDTETILSAFHEFQLRPANLWELQALTNLKIEKGLPLTVGFGSSSIDAKGETEYLALLEFDGVVTELPHQEGSNRQHFFYAAVRIVA